jgi:outer membrane protein assembly factor BamB
MPLGCCHRQRGNLVYENVTERQGLLRGVGFPLGESFSKRRVRRSRTALGCLLLALLVPGPTAQSADAPMPQGEWPLANHDLSSTRFDPASDISRQNVGTLHVAWRFRLRTPPGDSGVLTATPVVAAGVVFVQDMQSNVFALDLKTGSLRWRHRFSDTNPGPDGVVVDGGRVYGATDTSAFALSARTGRLLWRRLLVRAHERYVDVAPQVANGSVYISTIGVPPDGHGALYALSRVTGKVRWRLSTIRSPWRIPSEAGGGGAWYPPSVDHDTVFWGTANPYPYGGTKKHSNGGAYAGPALYSDSLLAVHGRSGKIAWYDQVTPHDVRDYDFQLSPVLATVGGRSLLFGAGKAGVVIAWDRATHRRVWQTTVGVHRSDAGPLPLHRVTVCPGLLGGVETPMAYADQLLFVPVVNLCMRGSSIGYEDLGHVDIAKRARGELVALDAASGKAVWVRRLPHAVFGCATVAGGVVFTSTFDGEIYAFDTRDGTLLWGSRARAGINSCPAVAGTTLLVGAGVPRADGVAELTAYRTR